ncbi:MULTISPECIES: DUF397 domain-containing protein [Streptomyces]|uniref:DUF397 domain-containing protein n=1 Tax=Streptomyces demainii TaxID=588122 RepID=A0ABT9KKZ8_9ACTN|nr:MULTISPECIES: DUF397 domain-containing protein [Streptomyces]MBW8093798.1 DUF397 domain-containing protein [Streptomyces hygroscopicus subsp. hygroscopicus]MDP9609083.1 hypothetical protein [Streptomyces demainii]
MSTYQWRKSSYSANSSNCINIAWRKSSYSADAGNCVNLSADWRKSTHSGDASNCVNVAASDRAVLLRESDDPDVILSTTPASLRAFIRGAKAGDFDCLRQGGA